MIYNLFLYFLRLITVLFVSFVLILGALFMAVYAIFRPHTVIEVIEEFMLKWEQTENLTTDS